MFGRKPESPDPNDIDTIVIEEEPILGYDPAGQFAVDINEEEIIAGEYHDVLPPAKPGNGRKVIFLAVVALFAVGGVASIFSSTSVATLKTEVASAIPFLDNRTSDESANRSALADQLQTPEEVVPTQVLPASLATPSPEPELAPVPATAVQPESTLVEPTTPASPSPAATTSADVPATTLPVGNDASKQTEPTPSSAAQASEPVIPLSLAAPASPAAPSPEKTSTKEVSQAPQTPATSTTIEQAKAPSHNTPAANEVSKSTVAKPTVSDTKKSNESSTKPVAEAPQKQPEPKKEVPKKPAVAKADPQSVHPSNAKSKPEASEKNSADETSEAGIKRLITMSAESLGLVAMQPGFITIERKSGGTNRLTVGDRLDSGEQITHIDAASSTLVTDRSVIRITL